MDVTLSLPGSAYHIPRVTTRCGGQELNRGRVEEEEEKEQQYSSKSTLAHLYLKNSARRLGRERL
jgi:hypothetical protein